MGSRVVTCFLARTTKRTTTRAQFVVSYRMSYDDNICEITEFYRGPLANCQHIVDRFGGGSDERRPVRMVEIGMCTLENWQEFIDGCVSL